MCWLRQSWLRHGKNSMADGHRGTGFTHYVDGRWIRGQWDAHGLQLTLGDKTSKDQLAECETPSAILDVYAGRAKLCAFDQDSDEPRVVVEFGDKGEILRVAISGVPHARVVHQP